MFHKDGNIWGAGGSIQPYDLEHGWYFVEVKVDFVNGLIDYWIDGSYIISNCPSVPANICLSQIYQLVTNVGLQISMVTILWGK